MFWATSFSFSFCGVKLANGTLGEVDRRAFVICIMLSAYVCSGRGRLARRLKDVPRKRVVFVSSPCSRRAIPHGLLAESD